MTNIFKKLRKVRGKYIMPDSLCGTRDFQYIEVRPRTTNSNCPVPYYPIEGRDGNMRCFRLADVYDKKLAHQMVAALALVKEMYIYTEPPMSPYWKDQVKSIFNTEVDDGEFSIPELG